MNKKISSEDILNIEKTMDIMKVDMSDSEFEELQKEVFKDIEAEFTNCGFVGFALATISIAIGNLMAIANEMYGVQGVLKLATDYNILFNELLMNANDKLRHELLKEMYKNTLKRSE